MNSVELRAERQRLWARMKEINDLADAEGRDLTAEEQGHFDATRDEFMASTKRIERQEFLETTPIESDEEQRRWNIRRDRSAGPPASEEEAAARDKRSYEDAFREYISAPRLNMVSYEAMQVLNRGVSKLSDDDDRRLRSMLTPKQYQNAMGVSTQTGGGFLVPDAIMQRVEKALLWFGGMRQASDVITTDDGADIPWPVYDDTSNVGRRLAENTAATRTDVSVGLRVMKAYMYTSDEVLVSLQLLQDRPDIADSIIADALGERIARVTNTEFTTYAAGDGPQGIVPAVTSAVTAASSTAVTADELRNLKYGVNRAYRERPGAAYMMHDQTLRDIIGLKDGEGNYIFVPDPRVGGEGPVWGSTVIVNNDVPTMATGNKAVLYGDFGTYKIREVRGFSLLRLNELYAASLQVSFLGFARYDGAYINAGQNPVQCITML